MVAAFAFASAGNVRNDLGDIAIDRVAHPERPLARGSVTPGTARQMAVGLYLLALAAGILVSWTGAVLVLAAIPIMEGYERWAKQRGFLGNLLIGILTGAPFILGGVAVGHVGPALLALASLAALATVGREILKDVEDVEADRGARWTLPMKMGPRGAALVAGAFLLVAVSLSPLPWALETVLGGGYLLGVAAADGCFVSAALLGFHSPERAQRLAKLGMVAALVALVLGRAQMELTG
jgi:geranylgeranylglycerol-phosphate geranylgeranyltransferase